MTVDMPNALRTFLITTSRDECISLSAIDETQAKRLFTQMFPRKRISTVHEYPPDILKTSNYFK